jgi:Cu+-exporting ATPase
VIGAPPVTAGEFGFACGMNMIRGTLIVQPSGGDAVPGVGERTAAGPGSPAATAAGGALSGAAGGQSAAGAEAAQAAERQAEIADLARRVIAGAMLTLPVLYAVMAHELFKVWAPAVLLNHWAQLALITPVMFYTGWQVHRTGWLALAHRSADMNSLITIGTTAAYGLGVSRQAGRVLRGPGRDAR